jgi:ATP-dependent Lon protease
VAISDELYGQSGYLALSALDISSLEKEQYTLFTAITDDGRFLTQNECEKLFLCGGVEMDAVKMDDDVRKNLDINAKQHSKSKIQEVDSRNLTFFKEEETRIYRWEKDVIDGLENEIDTIKRTIRETERLARLATNVKEQIELQQRADDLRRQKRRKRNELEDREDEVAARRKALIKELENKMIQTTTTNNIFYIRWQINA